MSVTIACQPSPTEEDEARPPANEAPSNSTSVAPAIPVTDDETDPDSQIDLPVQEPAPAEIPSQDPDDGSQVTPDTVPSEPAGAEADQEPAGDGAAEAIPRAWGKAWEPVVAMSQSHADTCLVAVGDTMPSIELPDLDGTSLRLEDLIGKNLTVVLFWDSQYAYAREQYQRLTREVVEPFGSLGVNVVAIHVGDDIDVVRQLAASSEGKPRDLLDLDHSTFDRVATEKLPRTYLLDASGKILWLDIEYSRGFRRELENAIRFYLSLQSEPRGQSVR